MPTYEYECPKGHVFELFQKMSDPTRKKCPKCGKMAQRRISAGAGLLFKGEGFYITDNRPESYKEKAKFEIPGSTFGPSGGKSEEKSSSPSDSAEKSSGAKEGGTSGAKGSSAKKGGPGGKKGRK